MSRLRTSASLCMLASGALVSCAPAPCSSVVHAGSERPAGVAMPLEDAGVGPVASLAPTLVAAAPFEPTHRDADLAGAGGPETAVSNPEPLFPPPAQVYECRRPPATRIPMSPGCARGEPYPACRWQMPLGPPVRGLYAMWRNTVVERWWGRPALVGVLLAVAREFRRLHPEQPLHVGDLDAAGPRHATHDRGVDVDLYLPGAMVTENEGAGAQPWNYWDQDPREVESLRWRVEELARILATCTGGDLRIYYNDPVVEQRFLAWFRDQGYRSSFGAPMQPHNALHQFHFHVTIAEDAAVPPELRASAARHP